MKHLLPLLFIICILCPVVSQAEVTIKVMNADTGLPFEGCIVIPEVWDGFSWQLVIQETNADGKVVLDVDEGQGFNYWIANIIEPQGWEVTSSYTSTQVPYAYGYNFTFFLTASE